MVPNKPEQLEHQCLITNSKLQKQKEEDTTSQWKNCQDLHRRISIRVNGLRTKYSERPGKLPVERRKHIFDKKLFNGQGGIQA